MTFFSVSFFSFWRAERSQTGTEQSVDRLMKQITSFITELTDEFKMIVVEAIRSLSLKFPKKQAAMLSFLSGMLRDEGGYEFKRTIVEAIFDMIRFIAECKETGTFFLPVCVKGNAIQVKYLFIYLKRSVGPPMRVH